MKLLLLFFSFLLIGCGASKPIAKKHLSPSTGVVGSKLDVAKGSTAKATELNKDIESAIHKAKLHNLTIKEKLELLRKLNKERPNG